MNLYSKKTIRAMLVGNYEETDTGHQQERFQILKAAASYRWKQNMFTPYFGDSLFVWQYGRKSRKLYAVPNKQTNPHISTQD